LKSHKEEIWKEHPFLTRKGIDLIKLYTPARISIGLNRYGSYKDYGEEIWRIGYGSKKLGKSYVSAYDKASLEQINTQLENDLKEFSDLVSKYIFIPLNRNRKAAVLSFAHSIGITSFKSCRLLGLLNNHESKNTIIREWSPYINTLWRSGGDGLIDRRRTELNLYYAPDKEIPTFIPHKCKTSKCLLNLVESYNGNPNQIKAIEYLERCLCKWDPTGRNLRRFFQMWSEKPKSLGSPKN
jgi:GH24 family phage-related lysozyme (muramidase)